MILAAERRTSRKANVSWSTYGCTRVRVVCPILLMLPLAKLVLKRKLREQFVPRK